MAIEVKIPLISEGVETAEVIEVLVSEGDSIKEEQSIIALETDKASVEVPSSHSGVIQEIKVSVGDEVKVGDVILILEEEDEESKEEKGEEEKEKDNSTEKNKEKGEGKPEEESASKSDKKDKEQKKDQGEEPKADKGKDRNREQESEDDSEKDKRKDDEEKEATKDSQKPEKEATKDSQKPEKEASDVPASPSVRRLARESGVDIKLIEGSGPGGRITEEDVKSQSTEEEEKGDEGKSSKPADLPDFSKRGIVERKPLSKIRKTTAKNTLATWQNIPHVFQFDEADISGIMAYIDENKSKTEDSGGKLTITAILAKIMATALQQFPQFNASIDMENGEVILKKYFHIGIAVDTDKGLLVPVIRDVNKKTIVELAVEISDLAEKTRQGKLSLEEMQGGNITISNLGGIGGTQFTPIVYSPQVAILGVSRAKVQPVYTDGNFEPRQILLLSLSYDHRLIDGADGAKFLRWICQALEDPYKALLGA